MRKKTTLLLAIGALCVALFGYVAHALTVSTFHDDACLVIGMTVANKIEAGEAVSEDEVRSEIASLIRGSVIHGRVDTAGHPTDLNGNDFQIEQTSDRVIVSTEFSFLQPKSSRAEVAVKAHNKITGANHGQR